MKLIRVKNDLTVILNSGETINHSNCEDNLYNAVVEHQDNEAAIRDLLSPRYVAAKKEYEIRKEMLLGYLNSEYLSIENNQIYVKSISLLSLPETLATAILTAERDDNLDLLATYLNFWTLCSLNPDAKARKNLFWFLERYGMSISKSGLFVAYRNVVLKKEGSSVSSDWVKFITDEFTRVRFRLKKAAKNYFIGLDAAGEKLCTKNADVLDVVKGNLAELYADLSEDKKGPVYTDQHSKSFTIKIGVPVTMPREKCDPNHDNTCSRGLHVAGKTWLTNGYFGGTGLRVLVNPADVVAVPPEDNYGKMRTCAYYPVALISYDTLGNIADEKLEDGFEDNFVEIISYLGEKNTDDCNSYGLTLPSIPEINREDIMARLDNIKEILKLKDVSNED